MAVCVPGTYPVPLVNLDFSILMAVITPCFVFLCLGVFLYYRRRTSFLMKRPLYIILFAAVGTLICWAVTPIFDIVGPDAYPCWLFGLLFHLVIPFACAASPLKVFTFFNRLIQIKEELGPRQSFRSDTTTETNFKTLPADASFQTLAAHWRIILKVGGPDDRILHVQFAKSWAFAPFWICFVSLPSIITFVVRLATDPRWYSGCTGCEASDIDMGVSVAMFCTGAIIGGCSNPRAVSSKDPLRIIRESHFVWLHGWAGAAIGLVYIFDPGQVYHRGLFNWRMLLLIGACSSLYVQTIHQVLVYHYQKAYLLQQLSNSRQEAFQNVMMDQELRNQFRKHLNSELSPEIYLFMEEVEKFRAGYSVEKSNKRGRMVLATFVDYGAPYEVNLSGYTRERVLRAARANEVIPVGIFDEAYNEIKDHLLNDSFLRFMVKVQTSPRVRDIGSPSSQLSTPKSHASTPKSHASSRFRPDSHDKRFKGFFRDEKPSQVVTFEEPL